LVTAKPLVLLPLPMPMPPIPDPRWPPDSPPRRWGSGTGVFGFKVPTGSLPIAFLVASALRIANRNCSSAPLDERSATAQAAGLQPLPPARQGFHLQLPPVRCHGKNRLSNRHRKYRTERERKRESGGSASHSPPTPNCKENAEQSEECRGRPAAGGGGSM
jgi:hypothetical protein